MKRMSQSLEAQPVRSGAEPRSPSSRNLWQSTQEEVSKDSARALRPFSSVPSSAAFLSASACAGSAASAERAAMIDWTLAFPSSSSSFRLSVDERRPCRRLCAASGRSTGRLDLFRIEQPGQPGARAEAEQVGSGGGLRRRCRGRIHPCGCGRRRSWRRTAARLSAALIRSRPAVSRRRASGAATSVRASSTACCGFGFGVRQQRRLSRRRR